MADSKGWQYGGSPIKVQEEEFHLFRDHEYVESLSVIWPNAD